jgi:hypothetical protein
MLELALPNSHALAVMVLIIGALILFTRESIPLQTTSLLVLVSLTVGFTVFPFEVDGQPLQASDFFLGFGHKALIAVCALMIVGQGLIRTGALEPVGRLLANLLAARTGALAAVHAAHNGRAERLHQQHADRRACCCRS